MKKLSAGLLVYRVKNQKLEVLIAHMGGPFHANKDKGHWSVPKGEYQDGEDPVENAKREFEEEIGQRPPGGKLFDLEEVKYSNSKVVHVWAVEGDLDVSVIRSNTFSLEWPPKSGQMQDFPEIDKAGWFDLKTAVVKLIPAQVPFLVRLADSLNFNFSPEDSEITSEQQTLL